MPSANAFETWLKPDPAGLCCAPGGFHVDPARAVDARHHHARPFRSCAARPWRRAGHAGDHRRHEGAARRRPAPAPSRSCATARPSSMGGVTVRLVPAGHILGSAQVVIEHGGRRAVVSGDYKRRPDPTAAPFELVRCDLFVTEATFGLPVFRHEPDAREIGRLLASLHAFTDRTHVIGAYSLGKTQRADRAAARGRLRPADLAARRAEDHVRSLRRARRRPRRVCARQRRARQAAGRDRAVSAVRAQGPLVAAADRSRDGLRLGLDARARPRPPVRRRAAAGDLRSLRLARADRDHRRDRTPRRCGSRTAARTRWCIRSA